MTRRDGASSAAKPPRAWPGEVVLGERWGAFRFLVREPVVVVVNVAATATNRCNELVSHCRVGGGCIILAWSC